MSTETITPEIVAEEVGIVISTPGFYDLTAAEYHADPCENPSLSSSIAVDLVTRSPAHARLNHPRLREKNQTGKKETGAMNLGSVVHELLLGKGGGFSVWPGRDWRGKEAGDFWDMALAAGSTPIKQSELTQAQQIAGSVLSQVSSLGIGHIFEEGESEKVAIWKEGNHYARAMFDRWNPMRGEIWDIKTTGLSAHPDQISRHIATMNYDMRSQFYLRGASALTGIPARKGGLGFCFLFVEVNPPFSIVPCYLDLAYSERGKRRAQEAVDIWARCMESGKWPSYVSEPVEIAAPGWVDYEIETDEISIGGGKIL